MCWENPKTVQQWNRFSQNAKHVPLSDRGGKTVPNQCFPLLNAQSQTFPSPRAQNYSYFIFLNYEKVLNFFPPPPSCFSTFVADLMHLRSVTLLQQQGIGLPIASKGGSSGFHSVDKLHTNSAHGLWLNVVAIRCFEAGVISILRWAAASHLACAQEVARCDERIEN